MSHGWAFLLPPGKSLTVKHNKIKNLLGPPQFYKVAYRQTGLILEVLADLKKIYVSQGVNKKIGILD